jgi:hypothetical protein
MRRVKAHEVGMALNGGARRFALGTVIRQALAITWHNLFRLVAIVVAVAVPVALLTALARLLLASGVRTTATGNAIDFANSASAVVFVALASVLGMLAYLVTQAALVFATWQVLRGRGVAIGAALRQALAAVPRLLAAGLLLFVGGGLIAGVVGFLVVQLAGGVPLGDGTAAGGAGAALAPQARNALAIFSLVVLALALTIFTLTWVFVPALVIDRAGPIACFKRSLALTKGRRWPVLAIILILSVANVLASVLTQSLMASAAPMGGAVLNVLAALFFMVLAAVLSAVGYVHLRAEKEGRAIDAVVRTFD